MTSTPTWFSAFDLAPAQSRPELLADPVAAAIAALPPDLRAAVQVAPIDADLSDTAAFCEHYGVPPEASANCVIAAGRREGVEKFAAVLVLATDRADINGAVRRHIDVRKISFAPMDTATGMTGMEYGGITPVGLPDTWPILVDRAVTEAGPVVIGSGRRASKIIVDGAALARFPQVEVLDGLAR